MEIPVYKGEHFGPQVIDLTTSATEPDYSLPASVRVRVFPLATGISVIAKDAVTIDRDAGTFPFELTTQESVLLEVGEQYRCQAIDDVDGPFVLADFAVPVRMMGREA